MVLTEGGEKAGLELIQTLVAATGLPPDLIEKELQRILRGSGHTGENLTLEQLRVAMAAYLDSIRADLESSFSTKTVN